METEKKYTLTLEAAQELIACSVQSMNRWISLNKIPSVKDGGRRMFNVGDCKQVRDAFAEYGKRWADHVSFEGLAEESETEEETVEVEAASGEKSNAQKIADLGLKLHAIGRFEEAADAMAILINQCDWSEVAL